MASEILEPYAESTKIISAEQYVTASQVIVLTNGLQKIVEGQIAQNDIASNNDCLLLCTSIKNGISERLGHVESNKTLGMLTLLDPRFKNHAFLKSGTFPDLKKKLISDVATKVSKQLLTSPPIDSIRETPLNSTKKMCMIF